MGICQKVVDILTKERKNAFFDGIVNSHMRDIYSIAGMCDKELKKIEEVGGYNFFQWACFAIGTYLSSPCKYCSYSN